MSESEVNHIDRMILAAARIVVDLSYALIEDSADAQRRVRHALEKAIYEASDRRAAEAP